MQKYNFPSNEGIVSHLITKLSSPQWLPLIILKKGSLGPGSVVWTESRGVGPSAPSVQRHSPGPGRCRVHTSSGSISQLPCLALCVRPSAPRPPPSPVPRPSTPVPWLSVSVHPPVRQSTPARPRSPTRRGSTSAAPRSAPKRAFYRRGRAPRARPAPGPWGCSAAPRRPAPPRAPKR